jgi:hypothetical protein
MARAPRGYRTATTALDARAKIDLSGPFFQPSADKRLRENIRGMMAAVAEEGASAVRARSPRRTGALVGGIKAETSGRTKWALTSAIVATHIYPWHNKGARGYQGRAEAEYRGGKAEARYRMFRAVTFQLRSARSVMAANLTRGLE